MDAWGKTRAEIGAKKLSFEINKIGNLSDPSTDLPGKYNVLLISELLEKV